ncbi:endonuclease NucS [Methanolobus sediminis]|uniref:Endonuclease NucS n=1 Tax=Methanolobus sediminis TaxID=3072978 RepID=A0AA51YJZ9_9EURY|nr:endonuclease NucS domain-containing protein [Methanolobus sediminis]WMW26141.1 endonuclease NucS [Methanolobus sediminis]
MSDSECITSCTRVPRYITKNDVRTLFEEISLLNEIDGFSKESNKAYLEFETRLDIDFPEKYIEDMVFMQPNLVEPGMKVISRQLTIPTGRIDLLLENEAGEIVILEIKKGFPRDDVVAQVLSYKGDIEDRYPDKNVKTAILCEDCSNRVKNAAKSADMIIYKYGAYFQISA